MWIWGSKGLLLSFCGGGCAQTFLCPTQLQYWGCVVVGVVAFTGIPAGVCWAHKKEGISSKVREVVMVVTMIPMKILVMIRVVLENFLSNSSTTHKRNTWWIILDNNNLIFNRKDILDNIMRASCVVSQAHLSCEAITTVLHYTTQIWRLGVTDRTVTTGFGRGREFIPPHPSYIGFGQGGGQDGG